MLRQQEDSLLEQKRRLRASLAAMQSLESVEKWAESHGMVRPSPEQSIVVRQATPARRDLVARGAK